MKKILIGLINLYQKTLSPDHGWFKARHPYGYCRFHPTCSEYAKQSIEKHGFLGLFPAIWRVLRCNPWAQGGVDLVK